MGEGRAGHAQAAALAYALDDGDAHRRPLCTTSRWPYVKPILMLRRYTMHCHCALAKAIYIRSRRLRTRPAAECETQRDR
eukprot:6174331-Pleurochrysis_carterae.AAC.2